MSIDPAEWYMTPQEVAAIDANIATRRVHYLECGEYIIKDDEFLNNETWESVSCGMVGHEVCKSLVGRFRRFEK